MYSLREKALEARRSAANEEDREHKSRQRRAWESAAAERMKIARKAAEKIKAVTGRVVFPGRFNWDTSERNTPTASVRVEGILFRFHWYSRDEYGRLKVLLPGKGEQNCETLETLGQLLEEAEEGGDG